MIIDTSAILAVLFAEEDATVFAQTIANADTRLMSAANYLEAAVVVDHQMGAAAGRQLDAFIDRAEIKIESVTREQAELARQAYSDFGKGHHPAGLNFGDCFAYALAKHTRLPILFKGDDFSHTDLSSAL
ncbi:MAG: ribonuclease [Deltaproteobacteria bacterium RIFOXYB12_FULL_58_9]|nr:MAG: ribonuclease [Deltaproteobacteria bacterium RIFOXYB12_FULL_58_9]